MTDMPTEILDAIDRAAEAAAAGDSSLAAAWTGIADMRLRLLNQRGPHANAIERAVQERSYTPAPPPIPQPPPATVVAPIGETAGP